MFRSALGLRTATQLIAHVRTPLYRNAYALMLSTAATSGLGILYWALAARYYPAQDVGRGSAAISAMMFLSGIAQLNLMSALIRFLPRAGRATGRLVGYAYGVSLLMSAAVGAVFIPGYTIWAPAESFVGTDWRFALWFLAATMLWSIFVLQDAVLTGLRQTLWVPLENTLFAILKIVLLIVFAPVLPRYGVFASWTTPMVLALLPINILIFRRLIPAHIDATGPQAEPIEPRRVARYVAGDYIGSLCALMSSTLLPVLVLSQAGASANAYFYVAWIIAYSIDLISSNMAMSLTVEGAADQGNLAAYGRGALVHVGRLLAPLALFVLIGAPHILRIFGTAYAVESATLLRLFALASFPKAINALYLSLARVRRSVAGIVLVQGSLSALILSLSYLLLGRYGITGVGIAWLASQTTVAVIVLLTQLRPVLFRSSVVHRINEVS